MLIERYICFSPLYFIFFISWRKYNIEQAGLEEDKDIIDAHLAVSVYHSMCIHISVCLYYLSSLYIYIRCVFVFSKQANRQTDRQTNRQTNRETISILQTSPMITILRQCFWDLPGSFVKSCLPLLKAMIWSKYPRGRVCFRYLR